MLLLAEMSPLCIEYFNANSLIPKLIHFLCQDDTPLKGQLPDYKFFLNKKS